MNDTPLDLTHPEHAGFRNRLSALREPTVMCGLICPVPGFLLLENPLGLVVYMALMILAFVTPVRDIEGRLRLPASLILGGLLVVLISDHPFAQSNWFLAGILPALIGLITIDWLDHHLAVMHPQTTRQPTQQGECR